MSVTRSFDRFEIDGPIKSSPLSWPDAVGVVNPPAQEGRYADEATSVMLKS
jgi:hypothetical protein